MTRTDSLLLTCLAATVLGAEGQADPPRLPLDLTAPAWTDDGAWMRSPAEIVRSTDASLIRMAGRAMVFTPLPRLEGGTVYRLSLTSLASGQIESLQMQIRRREAPYTDLGRAPLAIASGRPDTAVLRFRTPAAMPAGAALYLHAVGVGTLATSRLQIALDTASANEEAVEAPSAPADPDPGFALDTAWACSGAARLEHGADGAALRFAGTGQAMGAAVLALRPGAAYRLAAEAGPGRAAVTIALSGTSLSWRLPPGGTLAQEFRLAPPVSGFLAGERTTCLRLSADGEATVRRVSVTLPEAGAPAARHASVWWSGPEPRSPLPADAAATARIRLTGPAPTAVRLLIEDAETGERTALAAIPAAAGAWQAAWPRPAAGWYRLAVEADGAPAPVMGDGLAVVPPVATGAGAPDGFRLGHHLELSTPLGAALGANAGEAHRRAAAARLLGIDAWRPHPPFFTKWFRVEPEPGEWRFDEVLADAPLAHGIDTLGMLDTTARHASSAPAEAMEAKPWPSGWASYPARDETDWRRYVRTTVSHYRGRIATWEVWNEPDHLFLNLADGGDKVDAYLRLVRSAAEEARQAAPGVVIVAGGVTAGGLGFLERAIGRGLAEHCDAISFHGYGRLLNADRGLTSYADLVERLRTAMAQRGRVLPIWDTEVGISTGIGEGPDALRDSDLMLKGVLVQRAAGIQRVYLYSGFRKATPLPETDYRSLYGFAGAGLPIQAMLATHAQVLAGLEPDGVLADEPAGIHLYRFRSRADPGRWALAGWTSDPARTRADAGCPGRLAAIGRCGARLGEYPADALPLASAVRYFVPAP